MGFPVPWELWLRESFLTRIGPMLLDERALDRGWFQPAAVRALVDDHRSGRRNLSRQLWALWGLEVWARVFLDGDRLSVQRPPVVASENVVYGTAAAR